MPGNNLNITLPTVGTTLGPTYATQINTALQTIIDDLEAKVTPDELQINANLSFSSGGNFYRATNLQATQYSSLAAALANTNPNTLYFVNGEAYIQDGAGNNVQVTASGVLNVGSVGSINTTGSPAYGSGPEVLWSGTDLEYRMKSGSGTNDYADVVCSGVELRNGANTTTLQTVVTTDYNITFPATAPGANNTPMVIGTTGLVTFTRDLDVDTLTTSGNVAIGGTLTADTCDFSNGRTRMYSYKAIQYMSGLLFSATSVTWTGTANWASIDLQVETGEILTALNLTCDTGGSLSGSWTVAVKKITSLGAESTVASTTTGSFVGVGTVLVSLASVTVAAGEAFFVHVTHSDNTNLKTIHNARLTYSRV